MDTTQSCCNDYTEYKLELITKPVRRLVHNLLALGIPRERSKSTNSPWQLHLNIKNVLNRGHKHM